MTHIDGSMSLDDAVPRQSKYVAKEDCDPAVLVTISHMSKEEVEGDNTTEVKTCLHFREEVKPLILNQSNKDLLKVATGESTVRAIEGKQIVLFVDPTVKFRGTAIGGVRIRAPQNLASVEPVSAGPNF